MAGIIFSVDEDIQEINRLTKEVERLKKALFELPKTTNQIEFAKMCEPLEKQLQSVLQQIDNIKRAIIDANNHIGETAKRIDDATARVTSVQAKFITPQTESIQPSTSVRANASTITQTTNALQEQSDAYVGLRMEYEEYMNSVEHNTIKMLKLKDEIQGYNNTLRQLEMGTPSQKNQSRIVEITKQLEEAKIRLAQVRSELKAGLKLQVAAPDSMDALNQQLGKMREFYRSLTEEERNSPFGIELANGIAQADQRIKELDASIGNHQRNIGNYASGLQSIRAEQRGIIGEIATLTMAYREMTAAEQQSANGTALKDKIEELTTKAAQLKDVMADTNRAISSQANDTSSFTAISEGINLLISGYGLAKGAAEMLGMSEDDLIAVQTKLQAAFVASNALISMQKTLQKESTLMQGISILQTKAAAKAINIKTAAEGKGIIATTGATIAQKALNAVAKANPYVLLATALASVVGALWAFAKGSSEAKKSQEEFNNSVAESAAVSIAKIENLSVKWQRLGNDMEAKRKFIIDNKSAFDELGVSINSVADAQQLLMDQKDSFISAMVDMAVAATLRDGQAENIKKLAKLRMELAEIENKKYRDINTYEVTNPTELAFPGAAASRKRKTITGEEQREAAKKNKEAEISALEGTIKAAYSRAIEVENKGNAELEKAGIKKQESEREYWEKELAARKKIYEELQKTDSASAEALARVKEAEAELAKYNIYNHGGQDGNNKTPEQLAAEQRKANQAYIDLIDKQATERANDEKEYALKAKQAKIDGMAEGTDKVLAQMELDVKKEQYQLEKDKQEAITAEIARQKAVFDAREDEKAAKNSKYAKATFDPKTDIDTTAIERIENEYGALIVSLEKKWELVRHETQKTEADKLLDGIRTYEQARLKILEEYAKKRENLYQKDQNGTVKTDSAGNKMLRTGVSQGNIDEINRQEQDALSAIDEQFASRESIYKYWCESITDLTLDELQKMMEDVDAKLQEMKDDGDVDDATLARFRAMRKTLDDKVKGKQAKNKITPGKRSIKEWEDLYKTLRDVEQEFESIGDAVGGVAGDIIKECGKIATSALSMINGIVQLTNWASISMQMTAQGASAAIQTVEKASVILTIISAALQIAMQIASLFNNDKAKQEEINALQQRIDQLQWELDNADIGVMERKHGKSIDLVRQSVEATRVELINTILQSRKLDSTLPIAFTKASRNAALLNKAVTNVANAYAGMGYTADKALGADKYKSARSQLENIAQQQILIQEQLDLERSRKNKDDQQIQEWEQKIAELGKQAVEVINDMMEDIMGDTSNGIANTLSNAFFEAFQNGEDAAKAWGESVDEIVGDIVKRMLVSKFMEEPLGEIFDKYKAEWFPNGNFNKNGIDGILGSMTELANDLNTIGSDFAYIWENLPPTIKDMIPQGNNTGAQSAATAGLYETLSEDTGQALEGRFTAVQDSNERIAQSAQEITAFNEITSNYLDRMANLQKQHYDLANDTRDIIYNSYLELNEINTSLKTVVKQNKDDIIPTLNRIDKNTKQA